MRSLYLLFVLFVLQKASAQDVIYAPAGEKTPAKIVSILADKIKYKNPSNLTGPDYSKSLTKVLIAFNASGDYLVFNDKTNITEDEKSAFVTPAPARITDILVDVKGGVMNLNISEEKDAYISGTFKGKPVKVVKSELVFLIRKNGSHQLFVSADKAVGYLTNAKAKITQILNGVAAAPVTAKAIAVSPVINTPAAGDLAVDMKLFSKKAVKKTEEFSSYLNTICSVNTDRDASNKSINLACELFVNEESRVEVSSVNTVNKPKYKIRDYLNRLQLRSGQYDKVSIEYADISYASKFTKGPDGNYYAVITFVQKFKGFIDGKVVYGDRTKRNITVVLKTYEKMVDGGTQSAWDVFLENMGVVETKKA